MKGIEKELKRIEKAEERLCQRAEKKTTPIWKEKLEEKIPDKVMWGLQKMFSKAFFLIFEKGGMIIEKSYDKEALEKEFQVKDYAVGLKGGRKEIRNLKRDAARGNTASTLFTTAEGIVLGLLGIGLPDIVIWVGVLLRGVYETAMKYGFSYDIPEEKMFILKMLETVMTTGEGWEKANEEVDCYIRQDIHMIPTEEEVKQQIEKTANAFTTDMLVTKFIQGLPVIGIVGGAMNPVYYRRIMSYVQLKYRKRYLIQKLKNKSGR